MKEEIRKQMKALRRTLTEAQIKSASDKITNMVLACDAYKRAKTVCLYLSAYKEVDTTALLHACRADKKTVALPVTATDGTITLVLDNEEYTQGNFHLSVPTGTTEISPAAVDLFILPGLAFDKAGNRLGFGLGCYDRLLQNTDGYKIGICYAFQLQDSLPSDAHDIKMDKIIYA